MMARIRNLLVLALTLMVALGTARAGDLADAAGVRGGFIAHVGCADGRLTAALGASARYVVQGLAERATDVAAAREAVAAAGRCGPVSVVPFDGKRLPYVDSFVNLLVVSSACGLTADEVNRALAPGGAALVKDGQKIAGLVTVAAKGLAGWSLYRKPIPSENDEWTHYLHDPQGTSVSQDTRAGPPRGLRWDGGPLWARSHEHTAGMNAMVSAAGRVFYEMDEGLVDSIQLPAEDYLTARDAYNGVVLWKRPLKDWCNPLYPLKAGPGWLPRRLVAIGDRVYVAPGVGQEMLCLDAATGKVLHTYAGTASTFEFLVSDGVILAAVDPAAKDIDYKQEAANCWTESRRANRRWGWTPESGTRVIQAISAADGKLLWERKMPVAPMTLSADAKKVCVYDGDAVVALDRATGKDLWRADVMDMKLAPTGYAGPRMVLCGKYVVLSPMGSMCGIDADTGKVLWTVKNKQRSGHFSLEDMYVLDGRIWVMDRGGKGGFTTYNLADGKKIADHKNPIKSFYIHQRCHPGKATVKYLLPPIMGIELYDIAADTWTNNHWVRGGCIYGLMPANGLVYVPPHACACYYQSKLNGFNALAPNAQPAKAPPAAQRLVRGPAYGQCDGPAKYAPSAWPVFRHDNTRSGYVRTDVPAKVSQTWRKKLGEKLTQPVAAGGKLFLSAVEEHTVYALDADSGKEVWHFIAGGRVNSPPTLHAGMAVFGCADGWIYALRADDGQLAWRFQAAPTDRQLMSYGQVESVWPLPGSVLIQADESVSSRARLYVVAGRSMFLDGGLRMVVLNPTTGELISENVMDNKVPGTKKDLQTLLMGKHMPVSSPDILTSDGRHVYMKSQTFTMEGKRVRVAPQRPDTQYDKEVHLFSPISFLDKSWHHRTYWIFGRAAGEGWAEFQYPPKRVPCGRILCLDEKNAYGYCRDPELYCNASVNEYRLYSAGKYPKRKVAIPRLEGTWAKTQLKTPKDQLLAANSVDWKQLSKLPMSKLTALDYNWILDEPEVMAKAMVLANGRLFLAGPKDCADEKKLWGLSNQKDFQKAMAEQADRLKGKLGGMMQVFDKTNGKKLAELDLDCLPAFDGLIASDGKLFMVTGTGEIICYSGK